MTAFTAGMTANQTNFTGNQTTTSNENFNDPKQQINKDSTLKDMLANDTTLGRDQNIDTGKLNEFDIKDIIETQGGVILR